MMITEQHRTDADGNPAGGETVGVGMDIRWQDGPRRKDGQAEMDAPNGAFVESVIEAAIGRIEFFQRSKYACRENALAITKLQEAQMWLERRRRDRRVRGVEGMHSV